MQEFGMEIKEVRRLRLRQLIDQKFDGKAARLAAALDMKPPQVHRWLNGGQGMIEDSAKKICDTLHLYPGWLDRLDDSDSDSALLNRYRGADPATRLLIDIALSKPDEPIPAGLSPSLRTIVAMARAAIANGLNQDDPP